MEVGVQTGNPDRLLVDTCLLAGVDFLWLDAEHTDLTARDVEAVVARARGNRASVLVRVPSLDLDTLLTFANSGVDEIVLPRITAATELQQARHLLSFPPRGARPRQLTPGSGYGSAWTVDVRLSAIVETVAAFDAVAEIGASGIADTLWIGTKDLQDDFVRSGRLEAQSIDSAVQQLADEIHALGVSLGIGATDVNGVERALALGAHRCSVYWEAYVANCIGQLLVSRGDSSHGASVREFSHKEEESFR